MPSGTKSGGGVVSPLSVSAGGQGVAPGNPWGTKSLPFFMAVMFSEQIDCSYSNTIMGFSQIDSDVGRPKLIIIFCKKVKFW
jgi:hypothetical protein